MLEGIPSALFASLVTQLASMTETSSNEDAPLTLTVTLLHDFFLNPGAHIRCIILVFGPTRRYMHHMISFWPHSEVYASYD